MILRTNEDFPISVLFPGPNFTIMIIPAQVAWKNIVLKFVAWATWRPGFVHPWIMAIMTCLCVEAFTATAVNETSCVWQPLAMVPVHQRFTDGLRHDGSKRNRWLEGHTILRSPAQQPSTPTSEIYCALFLTSVTTVTLATHDLHSCNCVDPSCLLVTLRTPFLATVKIKR